MAHFYARWLGSAFSTGYRRAGPLGFAFAGRTNASVATWSVATRVLWDRLDFRRYTGFVGTE